FDLLRVGREPQLVGFWRNDHGHPVVNASQQLVGLGGDDRTRLDLLPRLGPPLPNTSEAERPVMPETQIVGLLPPAALLPLVKAVSHHQAAARFEGVS